MAFVQIFFKMVVLSNSLQKYIVWMLFKHFISPLFWYTGAIKNILKNDNLFMFDTSKFCYLWIKSLEISFSLLIIH